MTNRQLRGILFIWILVIVILLGGLLAGCGDEQLVNNTVTEEVTKPVFVSISYTHDSTAVSFECYSASQMIQGGYLHIYDSENHLILQVQPENIISYSASSIQ